MILSKTHEYNLLNPQTAIISSLSEEEFLSLGHKEVSVSNIPYFPDNIDSCVNSIVDILMHHSVSLMAFMFPNSFLCAPLFTFTDITEKIKETAGINELPLFLITTDNTSNQAHISIFYN